VKELEAKVAAARRTGPVPQPPADKR
jgi:hypothetical protein